MATEPQELERARRPGTASTAAVTGPVPGLPRAPVVGDANAAAPRPQGEADVYQDLVEGYTSVATLHPGAILSGRVVEVSGQEVIVDIGHKREGLVPLEQFRDPLGEIRVQAGDVIDVMVEAGEADGYVRLTHDRARRVKLWERLEKAYTGRSNVKARVLNRIKGGVEVDLGGLTAFLPGSQMDIQAVPNLEAWKGKEIEVRIIKFNRKRSNVVVSRRVAQEEESQQLKKQTLEALFEGAVVTGTVKNLTDYGVFVDLGGVDGLLHVTDISHGRVSHPSGLARVGEKITVKVLKFDRARQRVSLGLKQLTPDPWENLQERYPVNSRAYGRVMNVTDYGAFVELETGVEGLIHVSEMSWSKRTKHPSKIVHPGDQVEVVILAFQPGERKISLGLKQLEPNPWTTLASRYSVGSVVEGRVRNLSDFGAFVEIEDGVDGLVHISDMSWTKRVKHPSDLLKKGQRVQAVILRIETENRRLSLGIKQLQPDAWATFLQGHAAGDVVSGKVTRRAAFGVFVELAEGVEGLCHNSEIPEGESLASGRQGQFRIIKLNPAEKKIGLSYRETGREPKRPPAEELQEKAVGPTSTIEEALSLKVREEKQELP